MAQQYPSSTSYGGQYAQGPYYPQYNAQTPQQNQSPGFTPYAQAANIAHTPVAASNARRFEANSQVHTPPVPFQLPPTFNPEIFKHLANSNLPLPPPPPPLPIPFGTASYPSIPYPAFAAPNSAANTTPTYHTGTQDHMQHQNPQHQQQHPQHQHGGPFPAPFRSLSQSYSPTASLQPVQQQTLYPPVIEHTMSRQDEYKNGQQNEPPFTLDSPSVNNASSQSIPRPDQHVALPDSEFTAQSHGMIPDTPTMPMQPGGDPSYVRRDALQAMSDLVKAGISFEHIVQEGVSPDVVGELLGELGLHTGASVTNDPTTESVMSTDPIRVAPAKEPEKQPSQVTSIPANEQPLAASSAAPVDVTSMVMERKDRIARLLAAKRGQVSSNPSSASASPAPSEPKTLTNITHTKPTAQENAAPTVPSNLNLSAGIEPGSPSILPVAKSPSSISVVPNSVTPANAIFSIPGLFMNSADDPDGDENMDVDEIAATDATATLINKQTAPARREPAVEPVRGVQNELKRKFGTDLDMSPGPKRQASEEMVTRLDTNIDDLPTATPPNEAFTDKKTSTDITSVVSEPSLPVRETTSFNFPQKPPDVAVPSTRPKINQDKLTARMAALKADLLRRNSRQKALQEGMPALDAEIQGLRDRLSYQEQDLEGVRRQILTKEEELTAIKSKEKDILQRVSSLQQQLAASESGQQQFSTELKQLNSQITLQQQESESVHNSLVTEAADKTQSSSKQSLSISAPSPPRSSSGEIATSEEGRDEEDYSPEQVRIGNQSAPEVAENDVIDATSAADFNKKDPDTRLDHTGRTTDTSDHGLESDGEQMSIDQDSDAGSDGSASMSDSGSEEYEPAVAADYGDVAQDAPLEEEGEYDPEALEDADGRSHGEINQDHEEYEPTDVTDSNDKVEAGAPMILAETSNGTQPIDTNIDTGTVVPTSEASHNSLGVVASTDQSTEHNRLDGAQLRPLGSDSDSARKHYIPYQSPLSSLKSFRFHPQFSELVKDGYRSLTYSNQIDPRRPLCPTELSGEMCTDSQCEEQHFGAMALSDDKILVQMSSANDIKDKSQRETYLIGLKKVIADLRERGVKEFFEVANELSKYRRDWTLAQTEANS